MTSLFIEPLDVWLFRDGKAFDAGDDHHANSLFPPLPSVMQGAIRSHYLVITNTPLIVEDIKAKIGTATDYKALRLRGPVLRREKTLFYALPADVIAAEDADDTDGQRTFKLLEVSPKNIGESSCATPLLLVPNKDARPVKFDPQGYWVSAPEMQDYLRGKCFKALSGKKLFAFESRIGIARQASGTTQDGMLYSVNYARLCEGVGLHVEMAGLPEWKAQFGVMRIGGEGHAAGFTMTAGETQLPASPKINKRQFKLVLLTPTYFEEGWQPLEGNWSKYFNGPVKLEAAALHRYMSAGGYDWAKNDHKPALRYVPAGSVYYFSADMDVQLKQDWLCDVAPDGADIGQIGFGQVLVGEWTLPA